jgi:hypothetical protein
MNSSGDEVGRTASERDGMPQNVQIGYEPPLRAPLIDDNTFTRNMLYHLLLYSVFPFNEFLNAIVISSSFC